MSNTLNSLVALFYDGLHGPWYPLKEETICMKYQVTDALGPKADLIREQLMVSRMWDNLNAMAQMGMRATACHVTRALDSKIGVWWVELRLIVNPDLEYTPSPAMRSHPRG